MSYNWACSPCIMTYLSSGSQHDSLWNEVGLTLNINVMSVQFYQQYPKISSTKVKGQKIPFFCIRRTIFFLIYIIMIGFDQVFSIYVPNMNCRGAGWHKWDKNQLTFSVLFFNDINDKNPISILLVDKLLNNH